jgi:hypothetical protein
MQKNSILNSKGFSFLEIIISIFIITLILLSLTKNVVFLHKLYTNIVLYTNKQTAFIIARLRIERLIKEVDYSVLPLYPVIHNFGSITTKSGSKFSRFQVHQQNSPITGYEPANIGIISVVEQDQINDLITEITACSKYNNIGSFSHIKTCFLVADAKIYEGKVDYAINNKDNCIKLRLTVVNGIFSIADKLENLNIILPVERIYTLYVNQDYQLKYIQHFGEQIIEHQTVVENSPNFKIASNIKLIYGSVFPEYQLKFINSENKNFINLKLSPSIEKSNFIDISMNYL